MIGADTFQPKEAILIANKDEAILDLLCDELPTAMAFKKSVESLSPEQRAFAKAFRAMQLQSTLFALCIVQIKPALEAVLNLPPDSLTKEIRLSQRLLSQLVEYQIPSDQLSFENMYGEFVESSTTEVTKQKVEQVAARSRGIADMIQGLKQDQLHEVQQEVEFMYPSSSSQSDESEDECWDMQLECKTATLNYCAPPDQMAFFASEDCFDDAMEECCACDDDSDGDDILEVSKPSPIPEPVPEPEPEPEVDEKPSNEEDKEEDKPEDQIQEKVFSSVEGLDITTLPTLLNQKLETLDLDAAVSSTILKTAPTWTKKEQKGLLAKQTTREIADESESDKEKQKTFDLLEALSRSGGLSLSSSSLHVVMAGTHVFSRSLIDYVVQESANPIEQVERSALIMGSVIYGVPPAELVQESELPRLRQGPSSHLF